ncbi:hypothetical protein EJB05_36456, partial [Eragrostis curvula]
MLKVNKKKKTGHQRPRIATTNPWNSAPDPAAGGVLPARAPTPINGADPLRRLRLRLRLQKGFAADMSEGEYTLEGGAGAGGKEQDRFLPIANISRIMRRAVPENGKIAKDAKDSVQECVSEFISFITSEASDKCMKEKRKTINGDDLIWSLGTLGFEDYVEPLKLYLKLYREGDTKGSKSSDQTGKKEILLNGEPGSSFDGF